MQRQAGGDMADRPAERAEDERHPPVERIVVDRIGADEAQKTDERGERAPVDAGRQYPDRRCA